MTCAKAFEHMADYMSIITGFHLTGPQMRQQLDTYKGRYWKEKEFKHNMGEGIEKQEVFNSVKQKLEALCPCFDCMDILFKGNPNIIPMSCFSSSSSKPIVDLDIYSKDIDGIGASVPPNRPMIKLMVLLILMEIFHSPNRRLLPAQLAYALPRQQKWRPQLIT